LVVVIVVVVIEKSISKESLANKKTRPAFIQETMQSVHKRELLL
jgi:hypothetical protein